MLNSLWCVYRWCPHDRSVFLISSSYNGRLQLISLDLVMNKMKKLWTVSCAEVLFSQYLTEEDHNFILSLKPAINKNLANK